MRVKLLYFAAARERAGTGSETVDLPEGASAREALALACARHPALQPIAERLRLAVDQDFAEPDRTLRDGSEVALIPPVSGGAGAHRLTAEPLSPEAPVRAVEGSDAGAVVSFVGAVRDSNAGKSVVRLDYEAYEAMALQVFAAIASHARSVWNARVAIHHRTRQLRPGDLSIVIAAAARHRADAFDACRYAIEELKRNAPIWKREHYQDGTSWVGLGS